MLRYFVVLLLIAARLSVAQKTNQPQQNQQPLLNLIDTLRANGLTSFASLIQQFGLTQQINGDGPWTLFAPTNAAIDGLPASIRNNQDSLRALTQYHITQGAARLTAFMQNEQLVPSILPAQGQLFTQIRINIYEQITNGLVMGVYANGKLITIPNIGATNGVIQVLEGVMTIPGANTPTFITGIEEASTFNRLLQASTVDDQITGNGPFTGFVSVDSAWARLDPRIVTALQEPANANVLNQLMQFSFVSGLALYSPVIRNGVGATTLLQGANLQFGNLLVQDANVIAADFATSNGVVQIIDRVLVPPGVNLEALIPADQEGANTLAITTGQLLVTDLATTGPFIGGGVSMAASTFLIALLVLLLL